MFLPWRKGRNIGGYSYLCPFNFDVDFMMYSRKEIWHLLAQNVINVTDTAFLGHVGEVALGASAMGGLLYICIYTVAFGFSIGSQILIARRNGEQNYRNVGPIMWQGSVFSLMMAAALLVLMYVSARPLIRVLISSDAIFEATYEFFTWRIWGFLFAFLNVMFRALYIGITQTKVLTLSAVVMAVVNVFLDYVLVKWGYGERHWLLSLRRPPLCFSTCYILIIR